MLKKIIAFILCVIVVGVTMVQGFGASAADSGLNISEDKINNSITVSGQLDLSVKRGGDLLLLRFIDEGENKESSADDVDLLAAYTTTVRTSDGNGGYAVTFAFDSIYLPNDLESDTYKLVVSGEDLAAPLTDSYPYSNPYTILNSIKSLKTVFDSQEPLASAQAFKNEAVILGVATDDYDLLKTDVARGNFGKILLSHVDFGTLPGEDATRGEVSEYNSSVIASLIAAADKAASVALLVDVTDYTSFENWYNKYYTALGLDNGIYTSVVKKVMKKSDFVRRISAVNDYITEDEIDDIIYDSALLAGICELSDSEVKKIMQDYPEKFTGINWGDFARLSSYKQADVISDISGTAFESFSAVATAMNIAISDAENSGGGDSGGSYGGATGSPIKLPNKEETMENETASQPEKNEDIFTDIKEAVWAREAIEYLYSKGIVNGNPDGSFEPNKSVTRAEFIKMAVIALGIKGEGNLAYFSDVTDNMWFAPYVAAAYENKLIYGDENGCFNPDAPISRQDMATMLHRAIKPQNAIDNPLEFTDKDEISDYAAEAVEYFSAEGIVNGMGDGRFAPKESATRAQAAKIFYNIIKLYKY